MTEHMTNEDDEWLEVHVRRQIDAALDKKMARFFWAVLVMIFGGISSITMGAIAWGKISNRMEVVERHSINDGPHMSMEKKIQLFVPRVELENNLRQQRDQISEVKSTVLRIEAKLDKL